MKLNNRLNNSFIVMIVVVICLTAFTATSILKNSLNSFVQTQRDEEFNNIAHNISALANIPNGLSNLTLSMFAKDQGLNISYRDNKGNIKAAFNGIEDDGKQNKKLVTKSFEVLNGNGEKIGFLDISFIENTFAYNQSISKFYTQMLRYFALVFIFSILIASMLVFYLSNSISKPITSLNKRTKNLKSGKYDIDDGKYNIYELDELSSNLNHLARTLSMQEKYRLDYSQDIAHELRTPLTNLLLHLEGIRDNIIDPDPETINMLVLEIKRLNSMVDNLQISFNETEKLSELDISDCNLSELLEAIAFSFSPKMDEKNIDFKVDIEENLNVATDKNKFSQIMNNIISNAIKAVEENGFISLNAKSFSNRIVINVADKGIGISEDDLPHIFDRFYRVDSVRNSKQGGHGLGLSITKSLADLLGYNLKVNSELGKGTEFIITIDLNK